LDAGYLLVFWLAIGRVFRLLASYFLLLRQKKRNQRKGDPNIPEFPNSELAERAAKNSARFC
jgi:hypothetical protein